MTKIGVGLRLKPEPTGQCMDLRVGSAKNDRKRVVSLQLPAGVSEFEFEHVFDDTTSQDAVFAESTQHIVDEALRGFNGCVFAYGQTGAGKTYTMTGPADVGIVASGLCKSTIRYLFSQSASRESAVSLTMSILEIYNESLIDLLKQVDQTSANGNYSSSMAPSVAHSQGMSKLSINNTIAGVEVGGGLTMTPVDSESDAMMLLQNAQNNRAVADHAMNRSSSRSHVIYTFYLSAQSKAGESMQRSKLHLIDLAGSERAAKTGSEGAVQREANYINKSLSYLEQVVIALTKASRDHVPYRQSKLTYLLKDSLGGNCNTYMIACISPHADHTSETLSTLRFAQRISLVENSPIRNMISVMGGPESAAAASQVVSRLQNEVEKYKKELVMRDALSRKGPWLPQLNPKQQDATTRQVINFVLDDSTGAGNLDGGDDKTNHSNGKTNQKGYDLEIHSLSQAQYQMDLMRRLLMTAVHGDQERLLRAVHETFPSHGLQGKEDNRTCVEGKERTRDRAPVHGHATEAPPTLPSTGANNESKPRAQQQSGPVSNQTQNDHSRPAKENEGKASSSPTLTKLSFDEFKAGPGSGLHRMYEELSETLKVCKAHQKAGAEKVNHYKGMIDTFVLQIKDKKRQLRDATSLAAKDDKGTVASAERAFEENQRSISKNGSSISLRNGQKSSKGVMITDSLDGIGDSMYGDSESPSKAGAAVDAADPTLLGLIEDQRTLSVQLDTVKAAYREAYAELQEMKAKAADLQNRRHEAMTFLVDAYDKHVP